VGEGVLGVVAVVLDIVRVFWIGCSISGYGVGVLEYERFFLERVWIF